MGGKKNYINILGSFTEPFNYNEKVKMILRSRLWSNINYVATCSRHGSVANGTFDWHTKPKPVVNFVHSLH